MEDEILTILTNYKRPKNLVRIIPAFQAQTIPTRIIVVDNSPLGLSDTFDGIHDIWRMKVNYGPPCRFSPAFLEQDSKYILFYDDDMLPGSRLIENLLNLTKLMDDKFTSLGEKGRRFGNNKSRPRHRHVRRHKYRPNPSYKYTYNYTDTPTSPDKFTPIDMTVRAHLVRTDLLYHLLEFKWALIKTGNSILHTLVSRHDDILLNLGIQKGTNFPSYLIPTPELEQSMFKEKLPDHDAINEIPSHLQDRELLINQAESVGWKQLWLST